MFQSTIRRAAVVPISFLSVFFIHITATAQEACFNIFEKLDPMEERRLEIERQEKEMLAVSEGLTGLVETWQALLLGRLRFPEVKVVLTPKKIEESYFSPLGKLIQLGTNTSGRSTLARDAVFAHEFAHSIFEANFKLKINGQEIALRDVAAAAAKEVEAAENNRVYKELAGEVKEIQATLELAREVGAKDTIRDLESLLQTKATELMSYTPALNNFRILSDMLIAYNELFADAFPALHWRNHRVISDALANPKENYLASLRYQLLYRGKNIDASAIPRDFSITSFKNWKHEMADAYTLFDPVRGVLWSLFMKNLPREDVPLFLSTYLEAAARHVELRIERGEDLLVSSKAADPVLINREFLQIFVSVAKKNGLQIRKDSKAEADRSGFGYLGLDRPHLDIHY